MIINNLNVIGKKNNQKLVSDADVETQPSSQWIKMPGNSVNLVSDIILFPLGWDFSVCIKDR